MANDPNANLKNSAAGPASFAVDGQSGTEHKLTDQIEVTKFLMATRARTNSRTRGLTFTKLIPHGAVLPPCNRTDGGGGPTGL